MNKPLPYVTAALLCQQVLQEKNENISLVRIADRIQYKLEEGVGLPEGMKPMINLQGLVGIKSGPVVGDHTIKLFMQKPSGARKEIVVFPVHFLGKDHGQNLIINLALGIDEDGLYWFDVVFNEDLLTRIPLLVTPLEEQAPQEQKT